MPQQILMDTNRSYEFNQMTQIDLTLKKCTVVVNYKSKALNFVS